VGSPHRSDAPAQAAGRAPPAAPLALGGKARKFLTTARRSPACSDFSAVDASTARRLPATWEAFFCATNSARGVEGSFNGVLRALSGAIAASQAAQHKNFRHGPLGQMESAYFHKLLYLAAIPSVRSTSLSTKPSTSSALMVPRSRASR